MIGVIILSGLDSGVHTSMVGSSTIQFIGQPIDGDIITIHGYVFEFDDDGSVSSGHIPVTIGATVTDTIANFRAAGGV